MLVKCLIGKNQGLNSNHKVQTSKVKEFKGNTYDYRC